jgi:hypothetical protein
MPLTDVSILPAQKQELLDFLSRLGRLHLSIFALAAESYACRILARSSK